MQNAAKRQRQGGCKKGRKSAKGRRDKKEALKAGPNKNIGGDFKGRGADLKGSEKEGSDLKKKWLKTLKI